MKPIKPITISTRISLNEIEATLKAVEIGYGAYLIDEMSLAIFRCMLATLTMLHQRLDELEAL